VRVASHEAGESVRAGTVLAELEAPELDADLQYRRAEVERARARTRQAEAALAVAEAAIHRAQAELAQVRASIRRADAEVERGRTQFQRIDQLAKESVLTAGLRDESLNRYMLAQAARREIDARLSSAEAALAQARAERDKAQADLAAAQADITVAEAEIARAQVLERHRRIVAPHDGILLERRVEPGQTTLPGDTGEPLFILARNDRVRAVVVVPEDVAALMNVGQEAEIRPPTVEERCVAGKVSRLSGPLDPINPTWRVEIDLANPDHLLQPGQVVSVTVILDERTDVPTLPRVAVAGRGESAFCFVAEDGLARLRRIRTGLADDERVEVLAGLDVSDRIIVVDPATLSDGQPIHAVNLP
jgi:RND family efflux transporter MFP subunit